MAETKIGPIFRGANGGLSDDLFTGIRNSFYYSNDMEIREDAKSIYPKQNPRGISFDLGARNSVGDVVASIYFNDAWYIFTTKNVFKLDGENGVATGIASWFGSLVNENIIDAELFNGLIYISTHQSLFSISQTAADANWGSQSNFTYMQLNNSSYHPLYATDVLLAVGNGTSVDKVTKEIPDQVQSGIELQSDYRVRFIDELGGFIRITATDGYYGNEILLWDKVSNVADETIPMSGYRFLQSCIYNGYHYLLSDKGLGLMNGYQYYILKKAEDLEPANAPRNGMLVYDDKLYFVTTNGIYIYGAKNKNYNDVLNLWSARYDEYGRPGALGTDGGNLIYSESGRRNGENTTHSYVYIYYKGFASGYSGELQTMAYFGSSLSEIKQSMYLRVGYNLPNGNIEIYYKTEASPNTGNDSDWTMLTPNGGLKKSSDMRSPFATTFKLNCRFQWIQFKFILTGGNTKLYSADLYYNDMLD